MKSTVSHFETTSACLGVLRETRFLVKKIRRSKYSHLVPYKPIKFSNLPLGHSLVTNGL
jgi:hypothetical protein